MRATIGFLVRGKFGPLGGNHTVEVDQAVTGGGDAVVSLAEHVGGVAAAVGFVGIGEQLADVEQSGGAQQGVGDRVEQHVGVAVAHQMPIVRHVDAAQP